MTAPVPQAAMDAAMKAMGCFNGYGPFGPQCVRHLSAWNQGCTYAATVAAAVVAAVQGPIKAEALREAADAIEPTTCAVNRTCHESDAITLRIRAGRIDPTNQTTE